MNFSNKHIHCIGVGGMGMAPLAIYLTQQACRISGQDDALSEPVGAWLARYGIRILETGKLPDDVDMVVYSSAVSASDPRLLQAQEKGIAVYKRGEMLAQVAAEKKLLAVVGSHGKTTTVGMLTHLLTAVGQDFDYIMGGLFAGMSVPPARSSQSEWLLAEIDESDGTIDGFSPEVTIALNFDWDHPSRYKTIDELKSVFAALFSRTKSKIIYAAGDNCLQELLLNSNVESHSFGLGGDFKCAIDSAYFSMQTLSLHGQFDSSSAVVKAGGRFNALNACAALTAAQSVFEINTGDDLSTFPGIYRRQEILLRESALIVMTDYAHHPSEIDALLKHLKASCDSRLVLVFQPHRYTRTKEYAAGFARALAIADEIIMLPVYAACEEVITGVSSAIINDAIDPAVAHSQLLGSYEGMASALRETVQGNNAILFVGAGDIDSYARRFVRERQVAIDGWLAAVRDRISEDTVLKCDVKLARKTTLKIGGCARFYAEPANVDDLVVLLQCSREACLPVFVLGRGSNLIVVDEGYDGLVIHLKHEYWRTLKKIDNKRIEVGAGARLQALSAKACKWGMEGFEFLEGIPASIGGALRMNAGAMGGWIFDVVEKVEFVTLSGQLLCLNKDEFHVEYRYCQELESAIAIRATLVAQPSQDISLVRQRMQENAAKRIESQPREPSAGCIFKNPEGGHAGRLIDQSGLKGLRLGDAEVSTVHGNFIINRGNASSRDVIDLIRQIRQRVQEERGVDLRPEVMLIGKSWEDVL